MTDWRVEVRTSAAHVVGLMGGIGLEFDRHEDVTTVLRGYGGSLRVTPSGDVAIIELDLVPVPGGDADALRASIEAALARAGCAVTSEPVTVPPTPTPATSPHGDASHGGSTMPPLVDRRRARRVSMRADRFRDGDVPEVCIITGEPATHWRPFKAKSPFGALWLLALCPGVGWGTVFLIRAVTIKRTTGTLPINREVINERLAVIAREGNDLVKRWIGRLGWAGVIIGVAVGLSLSIAQVEDITSRYGADRQAYERALDLVGSTKPTYTSSASAYSSASVYVYGPYELSSSGCVYYTTTYTSASSPGDPSASATIEACPAELLINPVGISSSSQSAAMAETVSEIRQDLPEFSASGHDDQRVIPGLAVAGRFVAALAASVLTVVIAGSVWCWYVGRARARRRVGRLSMPRVLLDRSGEVISLIPAHPAFADALGPPAGPRGSASETSSGRPSMAEVPIVPRSANPTSGAMP